MKIKIHHSFHNTDASFYCKNIIRNKDGIDCRFSKHQTSQIWKRLCGINDCKCDTEKFIIEKPDNSFDQAIVSCSGRDGRLSVFFPFKNY